MQRPPMEEFALKETAPKIAGSGNYAGDKLTTTYDLVEQMQYLYVRVVKAKDLPPKDVTGSCDPYVEVKLGNFKGTTRHFEKKSNPVWDHVFAFSQMQSTYVEIVVKDKNFLLDDFIGKISFDLLDVPRRVPPDSPLAPQWYKLEDKKAEKLKHGEIMLAIWRGTQADECFPDAWHSDAASMSREGVSNIRGKVYLSPKLWYVRVNVIECQDLVPSDRNKPVETWVKVVLGGQVKRTHVSKTKTVNPIWNEDLVFVAAEPFEEALLLTVECHKDEVLGKCLLSLNGVQRRWDNKAVPSKWHNLEKHVLVEGAKKDSLFASKIHLRVCLDGGYHVLDESTNYSSDLTPTAKQLRKAAIGILELGIIGAKGLSPMKTKDGRATTDAYCVAKYGNKWVRTRTIIDTFSPSWNEQYTWEVHDPCTVITIGAFDNGIINGSNKDLRIGKVRIRLSTLETERVYTHSYPLIVLHPSGVKKMGEVHLAVRFSCTSYINMLYKYSQPILPKMHYVHPLSISETEWLRHHATLIVSSRLARMEPPLKKEVVDYMLDTNAHIWSIRKSKANFFRLVNVASGFTGLIKWLDLICHWKNPITTLLIHILFVILILTPELILPTIFLYLFVVGIWRYRWKPRHPPHMDIKISYADAANFDELDEEFDTFPTSKGSDLVRMRYDRLRSIGGRIQTVAGDLATQGERFHSLLNWRDPRASALFVTFCLITAVVLYVTPFQVVALLIVFYYLRHPRFRTKLPSLPANFFRRLPSGADLML
ncbi:FT-interacting protein 3-like [Rutidosis leptorrhynchoides]|uniref:FT-interacting protein 3-like n=1 Tax=Rutidosis leptorrhynchoides TaxID=125765 RepID=UPI003A99CDD9